MDHIFSIPELKNILTPIFIKYDIVRASVFGSYARGEAAPGSDINLLIYITEDFELEDYIGFKSEVENTVGKDIDILEYRCINHKMEKDILREAVLLYER